jgi:hypothetical protein
MAMLVDDKPTGPKKEYPVAPEGIALIVLADVEDLGIQPNEFYGPRKEYRLSWIVNEKDPEGNFFIISRKYTASLHEKSNLYADVKDILGSVPPVPYDLENLIGRVNLGVIKRTAGTGKNEGRTFANIKAFLTPNTGNTFAIPADFVRGKDGGKFGKVPQQRGANTASRTPAPTVPAQAAPAQKSASVREIADEDIPF